MQEPRQGADDDDDDDEPVLEADGRRQQEAQVRCLTREEAERTIGGRIVRGVGTAAADGGAECADGVAGMFV